MVNKQLLIYVCEPYCEDLADKIQEKIIEYADTHRVKQIDYFNISEEDEEPPIAFILFDEL